MSVYAPAVAKDITSPSIIQNKKYHVIDNNSAEFITDFIKKICIADRASTSEEETKASLSRPRLVVQIPREKSESDRMMEKWEEAENQILQVEKYKADMIPQGKQISTSILNNQNLIRYTIDPDDEFFHIMCHVDNKLKVKIRKGEFVELEKLLNKKLLRSQNSERMDCQIVTRGGESFIVPKERENNINGIHKWDQAFRVYAAIYARANPERAVEIWQYIETIHTAANTFSWESVANYDYTFRQLMAEYPNRNWAKIYSQTWNLNLCSNQGKVSSHSGNFLGASNSKAKESTRICWRYNRNKCRFGPKCRFEHRCSFCGIKGHPYASCRK